MVDLPVGVLGTTGPFSPLSGRFHLGIAAKEMLRIAMVIICVVQHLQNTSFPAESPHNSLGTDLVDLQGVSRGEGVSAGPGEVFEEPRESPCCLGEVTACGWIAMPGVSGCLRLASGKWSPMFPRCGPVLSCAVLSSAVLPSSVLSHAALTLYVVSCVSTDVIFVSFCFCCFPLSVLSLCLSVCLVFFLSVFVFCSRPCFEHLSTVQACTRTQMTALCVQSLLSRPLYPSFHCMCIILKGLGSLQKLAQEAEHRHGQLPSGQLHTRATSALLGNRGSQRSCVPALTSPKRSRFFAPCTLWCSSCVPTVP